MDHFGPKNGASHNSGSAIRIFLKFCPVNWANRQMKVIMVCTKEFCSGQIGVFWARKWHICINLDWLYRKSVQKEHTVKRCLIILDLKPLRSQVKGKHFIGREFQSLVVQGKKHRHHCNIQEWRNHAIYQNNEQTSLEKKKWNQSSQFRRTSTKVYLYKRHKLATF